MKADCIKNCAHHFIAKWSKTLGRPVAVAGCRVNSFCIVGEDACAKYKKRTVTTQDKETRK